MLNKKTVIVMITFFLEEGDECVFGWIHIKAAGLFFLIEKVYSFFQDFIFIKCTPFIFWKRPMNMSDCLRDSKVGGRPFLCLELFTPQLASAYTLQTGKSRDQRKSA